MGSSGNPHRIRAAVAASAVVVIVIGVIVVGVTARAAEGSRTGGPPRSRDPASTEAPGPRAHPVVVLYGDSLAWEARDHFTAAFATDPEVQVLTRTFGGTAICDFLDQMRSDAATLRPTAVVVDFSGNAFTPCMRDADGRALTGQAYVARYRADAESVLAIFGPIGSHVVFAGAPTPPPSASVGGFHGGLLNGMYAQIADDSTTGASFVDAGAAVLDGGRWTATLPCLPTEPCTGGTDDAGRPVNHVRAPDGVHFCPTDERAGSGVTATCPVWSSGAYRYGRAMAASVLGALPT